MKKFIAVLLAVLCVMSSFAVASSAAESTAKCTYCGLDFKGDSNEVTALYATHLENCAVKKAADAAAAEKAAAEKEAAEKAAAGKGYVCDYCGVTFDTAAALKTHIDDTFPTDHHVKTCECGKQFHTRVAYDAHWNICEKNDKRTNAEKMKDAFAAKDYATGFKYLLKVIVEFVKSDDFKNIFDKVVAFFKTIKLDDIKSTITSLAGKIPFDKLSSLISTDKITSLIKK